MSKFLKYVRITSNANLFDDYKITTPDTLVDNVVNPLVIDDGVKIINVATKNHWRDKSKITDIESSIIEITDLIVKHNITSVSIPALGCGLGGLDWDIVKPIMEKYLINVDCYVNIHLPH